MFHSFQPPCSYSYRIRPTTTKGFPAYTPSLAIWMGELSGGRSATSPTRWRSTSRRTRMEWQNSQVVWTALDQRNLIGAPQFGQLATLSLMNVRPLDSPDIHRCGAEFALEVTSEVPIRAGVTTEYVQTDRLVFGKSMTGEVRFGKQA